MRFAEPVGGAVTDVAQQALRKPHSPLGSPRCVGRPSGGRYLAVGVGCGLDRSSDLDTRGDLELVEDVAKVRLHGLVAQEQRIGDLGVRTAIDDEVGDLPLAVGQGFDAHPTGHTRSAASVE